MRIAEANSLVFSGMRARVMAWAELLPDLIILPSRPLSCALNRVAHSFGMITGGTVAIIMAITVDRRGKQQFRKSDIGLAMVVSIIALLSIALPTSTEPNQDWQG